MRVTKNRLVVVVGVVVLGVACGGAESSGSTAGGSAGSAAGQSGASGTSGPGKRIAGETFTTRVIEDGAQRMPAGVVAIPAKWTIESSIRWDYTDSIAPARATTKAVNPANEEAVFGYEPEMYFDIQPRVAFGPALRVGQRQFGLEYRPVGDVLQAFVRFIERTRRDVDGLTVVGYKELPDLPRVLQLPTDQGRPRGLGVKVTYRMGGKPVEEEFYAVGFRVDIPSTGPAGRLVQSNWGLLYPHSFRGPAGTLDQRRPVFASIVKSSRPNPEWVQRVEAVKQYVIAEFNRQMQLGYDQIAAAGRVSQMISANNDAMIATFERQRAASNAAATAEARSAAAKFSDMIRGVETLDDPYYGTQQLSNTAQFHWTDGYGAYRSTNDPTADPNRTEVGNWTLMRPSR